jgi:hypothetical protein
METRARRKNVICTSTYSDLFGRVFSFEFRKSAMLPDFLTLLLGIVKYVEYIVSFSSPTFGVRIARPVPAP